MTLRQEVTSPELTIDSWVSWEAVATRLARAPFRRAAAPIGAAAPVDQAQIPHLWGGRRSEVKHCQILHVRDL